MDTNKDINEDPMDQGIPFQGTPGLGDPGLGDPGLVDPGLGDPGLGDPVLGDPGLGDPWVRGQSYFHFLQRLITHFNSMKVLSTNSDGSFIL